MWVFTTVGFFSVVSEETNPDWLCVRGRDRDDMLALVDLISTDEDLDSQQIESLYKSASTISKDHDYQYRVVIPREVWANVLTQIVGDIDYTKFKPAIAKAQGLRRYNLYLDVWQVMTELFDLEQQHARDERLSKLFALCTPHVVGSKKPRAKKVVRDDGA